MAEESFAAHGFRSRKPFLAVWDAEVGGRKEEGQEEDQEGEWKDAAGSRADEMEERGVTTV